MDNEYTPQRNNMTYIVAFGGFLYPRLFMDWFQMTTQLFSHVPSMPSSFSSISGSFKIFPTHPWKCYLPQKLYKPTFLKSSLFKIRWDLEAWKSWTWCIPRIFKCWPGHAQYYLQISICIVWYCTFQSSCFLLRDKLL